MIAPMPTIYRGAPRPKYCRAIIAATVFVGTLLCVLSQTTLRNILLLDVPAAVHGRVWCLVTFNFVDNGLIKFVACWSSLTALVDSLELYLTPTGVLTLLGVTSACSGTLVTLSIIVLWRLCHDEALYFGHHGSQFALIGCFLVAWIQAHSCTTLTTTSADVAESGISPRSGRLLEAPSYPKPMFPIWKDASVRFVCVDPLGRVGWEKWFFEGAVYKTQYLILLIYLIAKILERITKAPLWLGVPNVVDLWCLVYGQFASWVWLRYFHFYASVRSRGDHSTPFEFAHVFFPPVLYAFVSPFCNKIHRLASKFTIFQLNSLTLAPRANAVPVLPLGATEPHTGLTPEQKSLREKGMEIWKHHMANPLKPSLSEVDEA